jgi:[NiFe] hydrogenase diaphorase moiety large subunit
MAGRVVRGAGRQRADRADVLLGEPCRRRAPLAAALARGPEAMLDEMALQAAWPRRRRLPDRRKVGRLPRAPGRERVVVCNADEGEPGTFKDRVLLNRHADAVFEGMTIAALAIGARRASSTCAASTASCSNRCRRCCAPARGRAAGPSILGRVGFDFDIAIHLGAGAYVCGEESALIESLEGKRGTPRIRPPFPVEQGYLGQPTVVNNVETFCAVAHIAVHGGGLVGGIGTPQSTGTKIHSVSGDCERPGLYEYPFGTRIGRILEDCGARDTQAVQVGGPSGVCLSAFEFGRRIAFEDVPTAGAFMVFDRSATCSRWRATSPTSSRTRAAASARPAASAPSWWCGAWTSWRAGRARATTSTCCSSSTPDAHHHPLRPGRQACNPLRDTILQVPPGLRAAPAVAVLRAGLRPRRRVVDRAGA